MNARIRQPMHTTQHAPSYYAATLNRHIECPLLAGEEQADMCVVGDGFSGVNTTLELARRGFPVVLLETHRTGWGASGHSDDQLTRGVGHDVEQFLPVISVDSVKTLRLMGLEAMEIVRRRVEQYAIDCDLCWGYCGLADKPGDYQDFREDMEELQAFGHRHEMRLVPAAEIRSVAGSDRYVGGLMDMGSGHLYPLNLILGETAAAQPLGVRLFKHSPMIHIDYDTEAQVHTIAGKMRTKTLVLGYNACMNDLNPLLDGEILLTGSCVIATEPLDEQLIRQLLPQNMTACDQCVALGYYRLSVDNRPLFGDAYHYSGRGPSDIAAYMRPKMPEVFPQLVNVRIDYQQGGMIDIGANHLPQVSRLPGQPSVCLAQAYSGHEVNTTHLAGQLLAGAIDGQQNDGFDLFAKVSHIILPGGKLLRSSLLALGMAWYRLEEKLGN